MERVSEKKRKRIESKKKKAEAFLSLVGYNCSASSTQPKPSSLICHSSDTSLLSTSFLPETALSSDRMTTNEEKELGCSNSVLNKTKPMDPVEEMKAIIRERKKASMQKPKVYLTPEEMVPFRPMPSNPVSEDEIPPLFVMDLQQLLLYGIQGNRASYKPRWCKVLRVGKISSVVLIIVNGLSYNDYIDNKDHFPHLSSSFDDIVEMVCPEQYGHSLEDELLNVPLSVSQLKKVNVKVPMNIQKSVVAKIGQPVSDPTVELFSRKCLLLSTYQMMQEGYPLPIKTTGGKYKGFVFSKDRYEKVKPNSPMLALDCEMCYTTAQRNELTRISIVTEDGQMIYDTLVKPRNRILNYLTKFSGITKEMLDPVTKRIEEVQKDIQELIPPDAILCGQSLNSDLLALQIYHPYVIDTSVIFNMSGNRKVKAGLRKLTQFFLGRTIQASKDGHCSVEDALATIDLVKLKLSKGLEFGDATLSGVYFPNIHTYFMGSRDGGKQTAENVEQDCTNQKDEKVTKTPPTDEQAHKDSTILSSTTQEKDESECKKRKISTENHIESISCSATKYQKMGDSEISSSSDSDLSEDEGMNKNTETASAARTRQIERGNSQKDPELSLSESTKSVPPDKDAQQMQPGEADNSSISLSSTVPSTTDFLKAQQEHIFNQDNSVHVPHSFFQLTKEAGRTACVIGNEEVIAKYESEPVEKVLAMSDSAARHQAKQCVQNKEFVLAQFNSSDANAQSTIESKQKTYRKVDKRLHSVLKMIQTNALVTVVLKGRRAEDAAHNMAAFVKTT